jgi:hypothetical protein
VSRLDLLTVSDPRLFFQIEQGFTGSVFIENRIVYINQQVAILLNKTAT